MIEPLSTFLRANPNSQSTVREVVKLLGLTRGRSISQELDALIPMAIIANKNNSIDIQQMEAFAKSMLQWKLDVELQSPSDKSDKLGTSSEVTCVIPRVSHDGIELTLMQAVCEDGLYLRSLRYDSQDIGRELLKTSIAGARERARGKICKVIISLEDHPKVMDLVNSNHLWICPARKAMITFLLKL